MQRLTPTPGQLVSLPESFRGVLVDNYHKVIGYSGTRRRSVYLRRCHTGLRVRMGLVEFGRKAKVSPQQTGEGK